MTQQLPVLSFSTSKIPLPYGILAAANMLSKAPMFSLKIGDSLSMTGEKDSPSLKSEISIYGHLFTKNASSGKNSLYPNSLMRDIEEWLVVVSRLEDGDALMFAEKISNTVSNRLYLVENSSAPTVADLSSWAYFKSQASLNVSEPKFLEWFKRIDAVPECQSAVKTIQELLNDNSSFERLVESTNNPTDIFRNEIARLVSEVIGCDPKQVASGLETTKGQSAELADFCIPLPKLKLPGNPTQLAQKYAAEIKPTELIESIAARGPFLNFVVNKQKLRDAVIEIIFREKEKYGTSNVGEGRTVIVEFSSPNIAKPFHAGHLRSTIIGNFVRNVHKALGYKTIAMNYLGDWGKQYGLLAVGFSKYGSEEELVRDPIKHLFDVYVKISGEKESNPLVDEEAFAYFKRMEEGDKDALGLWKRFRELSIAKYTQIYARLNIEFDIYSGESMYTEKMGPAIDELIQKKVATDSVIVHKGLLKSGFEKYGNQDELKQDPIGHLLDVLVKIHKDRLNDKSLMDSANEYVKSLSQQAKEPEEYSTLFKGIKALSLGTNKNSTGRLNLPWDTQKWANKLEFLRKLDLVELIVDLTASKLEAARIRRADGATLYLTRDIAAAKDRMKEYEPAAMFYVVGAAQDLHMQQLMKILSISGHKWSETMTHINFGMVKGMSTRSGNVVFLEDILSEAKETMHSVMRQNEAKYAQIEDPETVADVVGISAVIIQDMSSRRIKDYEFNWKRITTFEGDTGPYLQYAHSRLCSIERKYMDSISAQSLMEFRPDTLKHLQSQKCFDVLLLLSQYPDLVLSLPSRQFESSILVTYLFTLCHKVSSCYEELYVMGQERDVAEARFWLYWAAKVTVGNGMKLLGLKPLERM